MPCMCHMLSLLAFALLIRIPFGLDEPEDHLGTVLIFSVGGVLSAAVHLTLYQLLGPPISCKCYVFMMAPWTVTQPDQTHFWALFWQVTDCSDQVM